MLLPLILSTNAQNIGFEIEIVDDSTEITPGIFYNEVNGNGYIGLVKKRALFTGLKDPARKEQFIYTIGEDGDTISYDFNRVDTLISYGSPMPIRNGDPGYLMTGLYYPDNDDSLYVIFTRIDTSFNIVWEKIQRFSYYYVTDGLRVMELKNGDFLMTCSPTNKMFLYKFSASGDSLDFMHYEGDSAGQVWGLTYNHDSSSYLVHQLGAFYVSGAPCGVLEFDEDLELVDHFFYEDYLMPELSTKLLPNGNLLTVGHYYKAYPEETESMIGVFMYDTTYNLLYENHLTDPSIKAKPAAYAVDYSCSNCIYIAGTHNFQHINGTEPTWYYLAKLNDTLGIDFEKYIGGDYYYWLFSVTASENGSVLLTGSKAEVGAPWFHHDAYFIELDSLGCITSIPESSNIQIRDALVYPNPGKDKMYIRTALKENSLQLYDLNGRLVLSCSLDSHITSIETDHLLSGTYLYSIIKNNEIIETGKWIKN